MLTLSFNQKNYLVNKEYETIYLNGEAVDCHIEQIDAYSYRIKTEEACFWIYTEGAKEEGKLYLRINGKKVSATYFTRKETLLKALGIDSNEGIKIKEFKAPMPGLIRSIKVAPGENIERGQILLVLEAMKMENALKSPGDGIIKSIVVSEGEAVEKNQLLVTFE